MPKSHWSREEISAEMQKIVDEFGPWTAEKIDLGHGIYTHRFEDQAVRSRLRSTVQGMLDVMRRPNLDGLRILDVGGLEGLFAIEFARHGAQVTVADAREKNVAKIRFAAEVLGLDIDARVVDALDLDVGNLGQFDIVHCAGLLYHFNTSNAFLCLKRLHEMSTHMCVLETCFSVDFDEVYERDTERYYGKSYIEFYDHEFQPEIVAGATWSGNRDKVVFFFTMPSLIRALGSVGFSSVLQLHLPECRTAQNRALFIAMKGETAEVRTGSPEFKNWDDALILERPRLPAADPGKGRASNPETRPL